MTFPQVTFEKKQKNKILEVNFDVIVLTRGQNLKRLNFRQGANCSIKNDKGSTPYDIANKSNYYLIKNILKGNKYKYLILNYSNYTRALLILVNIISFSFIFFIRFDLTVILYFLWLIIYIFFLFQFYIKDSIKYNNRRNYLINILESEEQSIEDY